MIGKISYRIIYFVIGFLSAFLVVSTLLPFEERFTALDILRYFVFPGVVALFAAMFGAKAGAKSYIKVSQEDLIETYWGLMDLVARDIENNKKIMENVKKRIKEIQKQNQQLILFELKPEFAHTMFFEDIEYPKLRKVVSKERTDDIFHVRNIKYVFSRWNKMVGDYYQNQHSSIHKIAEKEIIKYLTTKESSANFITSCKTALEAIERIKSEIKNK